MQKVMSTSRIFRNVTARRLSFCSQLPCLGKGQGVKFTGKVCNEIHLDNCNISSRMLQEIQSVGKLHQRFYSNDFKEIKNADSSSEISESEYEKRCEETLEALSDHFEELLVNFSTDPDNDVSLSNGVLTVNLGRDKGIYIINKQTPNKQIWLSSPFSGPKRYDLIKQQWIYRHDNTSLHQLLSTEISRVFNQPVDFTKLLPGY